MSDNPCEFCCCLCDFLSNCDCGNLTLFDWIGITACIRCCTGCCDDLAKDKKQRQYEVVNQQSSDQDSSVQEMRMQRLDF